MKTKELFLATIVVASALGSTLKAQYTYSNLSSDLIYHSVASVKEGNAGGFPEGYGFAYTNTGVNPIRPEFIRTDYQGNLTSSFYYPENNGNDSRFLHIEDISSQNGSAEKQFLVVGSIDFVGSSALSVAILDESGSIVRQNHFVDDANLYFTGVKGIYNEESNEIAVIGVLSDGFTPSDSKDVVVMVLDTDLNLIWQVKASTPHITNDHDFVTDITPIGPHEYAIVGTSNDATLGTSLPATMTGIVYQGGLWSNNTTFFNGFSSYDNSAAVVEMPVNGGDLWVLSNANFFNSNFIVLMNTDFVGNVLDYRYINTGATKLVGFNLEIIEEEKLGISGYRYNSANEAIPFYMLFDPSTGNITDQYEYPTISNPGITIYNDNDLLNMQAAQSDIPYFYNEISSIKFGYDGVVFTANDDTYSAGSYGLKAYGVSSDGNYSSGTSCGLTATTYTTTPQTPTGTPNLIANDLDIHELGEFMTETVLSINEDDCGPLYKTANTLSNSADIEKGFVRIFPNPSSNEINVTNFGGATTISIHDISGKFIMEKTLTYGNTNVVIDDIDAGMYIVKIMKGDELIQTEKIQIIN